MVMTEDLNLGGGHTMQYTDDVSENCILETYIIVLTSVKSINFKTVLDIKDYHFYAVY